MSVRIIIDDCIEAMRGLPEESVHCVITSPPYYGLRDYGHAAQIGLESSVEDYVEKLVAVFREVRRVLREDGTVWLNLGDSYASSGRQSRDPGKSKSHPSCEGENYAEGLRPVDSVGIKPKDLIGVPWRVAFALQADGWYLRQDIIWSKPNPMPESVLDRCTKAHEYLFLLTKSPRYFYDRHAIAEPLAAASLERLSQPNLANQRGSDRAHGNTKGHRMKAVGPPSHKGSRFDRGKTAVHQQGRAQTGPRIGGDKYGDDERLESRTKSGQEWLGGATRNKRNVWTITTQPFKEAHFAVMPPALVEPCILAGTSAKGCCEQCGAPIVAVVERDASLHDCESRTKYDSSSTAGRLAKLRDSARARGGEYAQNEAITHFERTCRCEADIQPCTVLDPFAGAGTVGLVADRLHRDAMLIELNPEYAEIAERRILAEAPMFSECEIQGAEYEQVATD
jgi:DNA modification methylase